MKNNKKLFHLIATLLVIGIFFFTVELATRCISWASGKGFILKLHELDPYDHPVKSTYLWHPFTGFTYQPNITFWGSHPNSKGAPAQIFVDKHGFLAEDNNLSYEKAKHEIRIATIGASTTANINLEYNQNWPGQLGKLVQAELPDKNIKIVNAAVPGYDTAQSISNLALRVMPFRPDIVIIYHAYNDLKAIRYDREFKPDYSHIHTTPYGFNEKPPFFVMWLNHSMAYVRARNKYRKYQNRKKQLSDLTHKQRMDVIPAKAAATFEEHIRNLISIARSNGANVILSSFATLHDPDLKVYNKENVEKMSVFQRAELIYMLRFTPGLSVNGIFNGIKQYNQILQSVAKNENTGWVDNAELISHDEKYFVDRVHFTREGAKSMAENFLPEVLQLLKNES